MKHYYIIILFLFAACKNNSTGQEVKKDSPVTQIKDTALKTLISTPKYQQFFDARFNLEDTNSVEVDSNVLGGDKVIIVMARDTTLSFSRIVVLAQQHNEWKLMDSSGMLEADGRGPHFSLNKDTLAVNHGVHRGYTELRYTFDTSSGKFKLFDATQYYIEPYKEDKNCNCGLQVYQVYNERTHQLTIRTELRDYKRFEKLIDSKQKEFSRAGKQLWLSELNEILLFGEEDIFTVDDKEIAALSTYKK